MHRHEDFSWTTADQLACKADCETPWSYYEQTAVHFRLPDYSGRVVPMAAGAGDAQPPLGALHIVTAIQPDTDPASSDNVVRMDVLDRELSAAGIRSVPVVGASLDGRHAEESRAVFGLSDADARQLGLRFGQVAVFAWCGPRWTLLACAADRVTERGWRWITQTV